MSQLDIFLSRRSIRKYLDKPIPKDVMGKILEAGRQAPSAGNRQPWHFIVITDEHTKEALSHGRYNTFLKDAAATIVACGYIGTDESKKWSTVDTTIALQNIVLASWDLGVGSCWIGDFKEAEVKQLLGIPNDYHVVCILSLGYPAHAPEAHPRKTLEEIVSYERW
ncbi:nitroreductase family protein [Candidatus Bathyarchaeota archaeon]|nr:nitroreductase family protein [Candidatus Bathyarchaeota archaeon]